MATSTIAQRPSRAEGREPSADLDYRPSYLAGGIVSLCVLALYLITLAPSTAMWDTSEYITAAYTLGLPHPPGNPLFVPETGRNPEATPANALYAIGALDADPSAAPRPA